MTQLVSAVILAVPSERQSLRGREKVAYLSRHARWALQLAADAANLTLNTLEKDSEGAPLPSDGNYWSLTHKEEYVGGVVARHPVGIDLEKFGPVSEGVRRRAANEAEWQLGSGDPQRFFYRIWTAKEAVLKAGGIGFRDISKCRIVEVVDEEHLILDYQDRRWEVEQCYFDDHIAAVVANGASVQWRHFDRWPLEQDDLDVTDQLE